MRLVLPVRACARPFAAMLFGVLLSCGSAEQTTKAVPDPVRPVIVSLSATPSSSVEPGGTVVVQYSVTSERPLAMLRFYRTGAVIATDSVNGAGALAVSASISLPVPSSATVGLTIGVRLDAEDEQHGISTRSLPTGVPVVDRTPPTLSAVAASWIGSYNTSLDSLVSFTTDTLQLKFIARDNGLIGFVGYRVASTIRVQDSVIVGRSAPDTIVVRMPMQASLEGTSRVVLFARDQSGNETTVSGSLKVIRVVQRPVSVLRLEKQLNAFRYDAKRSVLFATHWDGVPSLEVISLSPLAHVGSIPLPGLAGSMDLTASGDSLLVAIPDSGSIAVVDLLTRQVIGRIPVSVPGFDGHRILDLAVSSSGKVLASVFVSVMPFRIVQVDLRTGVQSLRSDFSGTGLANIGASRARGKLVVSVGGNCLQRYTAATDSLSACAPGSSAAGTISSDAAEAHFLMGPVLMDTAFSHRRQFVVPGFNSSVSQLSADGSTVYFATGEFGTTGGGFAVVNANDGTILERQGLPIVPEVMLLLPDGSAMIAHGRHCFSLGPSSSGCDALRDIYVTSMR